jgi:raffinose/stachyose/melibiose transport system permease protein
MMEAGYYSFFNWNGYGTPTEFVGLRNYEQFEVSSILRAGL